MTGEMLQQPKDPIGGKVEIRRQHAPYLQRPSIPPSAYLTGACLRLPLSPCVRENPPPVSFPCLNAPTPCVAGAAGLQSNAESAIFSHSPQLARASHRAQSNACQCEWPASLPPYSRARALFSDLAVSEATAVASGAAKANEQGQPSLIHSLELSQFSLRERRRDARFPESGGRPRAKTIIPANRPNPHFYVRRQRAASPSAAT